MAILFRSKSDFKIERQLRPGGFGAVALVRHRENHAEYVLKEVNLTRIKTEIAASQPTIADRLIAMSRNEYAKMKQFDHPNIVRVFGSFEEKNQGDEMYFVVMEYCDGGDLDAVIATASAPLPEWQIQSWTRQLMSAVKFLHDNGHVHRDIKPKNVFLTSNRRTVKLGDFGLSKEIDNVSKNRTRTAVATWPYASPEMCQEEPYTTKCDIWSLGVLVYELANLKKPFPGDGPAVIANILMKPPAAFVGNSGYSTELREFVLEMLEKSVDKRPAIGDLFNRSFMRLQLTASNQAAQSREPAVEPPSPSSMTDLKLKEKLQLEMIRQCTVISDSAKDAICAKLESEVMNAEELADLSDAEVKQLFPQFGPQKAVFQWRQDFDEKKAQRLVLAAQRGDILVLRKILSTKKGRELLDEEKIWTTFADNLNDPHINEKHSGDKPLHRAVRFGQLEAVKCLIEEFDQNPTEVFNNRGGHALGIAAQQGHLTTVKFILAKVSIKSVNVQDADGFTCLHLAALGGNLDVVKYLVTQGANVNAATTNKGRPIHFAAERGHEDVVQYLVEEANADIETRSNIGRTPLMLAALFGRLEVVKYLLKKGANIEAKSNSDDGEKMAIHLAAALGTKQVVEALLNVMPGILEVKDGWGNSPLNKAVIDNNFEVVDFLVTVKKANIETRGQNDTSPLILASQKGHLKIVEFLLNNKANIEASDAGGFTAIHEAAYFGQAQVVALLLDRKPSLIELKMPSGSGLTPLAVAKQQGKTEVIKLLESRGAKC